MNRHRLLAVAPHPLAQLPACLLLILAADRLPDPLASHFGYTGAADGFAGPGVLLAFQIGVAVVLAVVFGLLAGVEPKSALVTGRDNRRFLIGASWFAAGMLGTLTWTAVSVNLDLADATTAVLPLWWTLVGLGVGALAGVVGYRISPPSPPAADAGPVRVVRLGATEQVSWSRAVTSRLGMVAAGALTVAGAAVALAGPVPWVAAVLVAAGIVIAMTASARVTIDRRGLRIGLGLLGWPRIVVPADDVVSAVVGEVSPAEFGGWGYRIVPGARGVILRTGPALVVTRRSGQRLVVTIDDPDTAAGLLNGLAAC